MTIFKKTARKYKYLVTKVHFDITAVAEKSKLDFLVEVVFSFAVSFPFGS